MQSSNIIQTVLIYALPVLFAITIHEAAHGYVARWFGDNTAYVAGRVTLNPLKHMDPIGSAVLPALTLYSFGYVMGWAKPCPITLRNFKHVRRDDILTSLAGPASNLAMALIALLLLVIFKHAVAGGGDAVVSAMAIGHRYQGIETDNLSKLFPVALLLYYGVSINLLLFVFNLIPIPPLDGSHVLRNFLPYQAEQVYNRIGGIGLLLLFFFGGSLIFGTLFRPLLGIFDGLLLRL